MGLIGACFLTLLVVCTVFIYVRVSLSATRSQDLLRITVDAYTSCPHALARHHTPAYSHPLPMLDGLGPAEPRTLPSLTSPSVVSEWQDVMRPSSAYLSHGLTTSAAVAEYAGMPWLLTSHLIFYLLPAYEASDSWLIQDGQTHQTLKVLMLTTTHTFSPSFAPSPRRCSAPSPALGCHIMFITGGVVPACAARAAARAPLPPRPWRVHVLLLHACRRVRLTGGG